MGLFYKNLTPEIRALMLQEIESDIKNGKLYIGRTLNETGRNAWPNLLRDSVNHGSDDSLADAIKNNGYLQYFDAKGRRIASDSHIKLAEGEFNRFYVRGLCLFALQSNIPYLTAYRARLSNSPRPSSEAMTGNTFPVQEILKDLQEGLKSKFITPNSGISFAIPE